MIVGVATLVATVSHHPDRVDGADRLAQLAALAELVVEADKGRPVQLDRGVGAVEPAEQAVDAGRELDLRLQAGAPAACARLLGLVGTDSAADRELGPFLQLSHSNPSSTAPRTSSAATFLPRSSAAASATSSAAGSPSAAASAPTMTMFTNFDPRRAAIWDAGTQTIRAAVRPSGADSALRSTSPSGSRPSVTSTSRSSDGSRTTTVSGRVTASWRRIGLSSVRVKARIGAPRR